MTSQILPNELLFSIINKSDISEIISFWKLNKVINSFIKKDKELQARITLERYQVDYEDPINFIYLYNKVNISDYKNITWKYFKIVELYFLCFDEEIIKCPRLGITSFPIYPNMTQFKGPYNNLVSFPVQPNMTYFTGNKNRLVSFPIQPKMRVFHGEHNNLKSFPVQPMMTNFNGCPVNSSKYIVICRNGWIIRPIIYEHSQLS